MNEERQPCVECGDWLDMTELEVGTGFCHGCGHAHFASLYSELSGELSRIRILATWLARASGFASITAAAEFRSRQEIGR